MKLTKKEAGAIRLVAFYKTVLHDNEKRTASRLDSALSSIAEQKRSLAIGYFEYLTLPVGKKVYIVDFVCNGAGNLTFYNCTAEEAKEQAIYKLQNGAFGKYEKLDDITIASVTPDTIHHNSFVDYQKSKEFNKNQTEQIA